MFKMKIFFDQSIEDFKGYHSFTEIQFGTHSIAQSIFIKNKNATG